VAHVGGRRAAAWLTSGMCVAGALLALLWRPPEKEKSVGGPDSPARLQRNMSTVGMNDEQLSEYMKTHKMVNGVKMVKIDLSEAATDKDRATAEHKDLIGEEERACSGLRKAWLFAKWLAGYDLYPLLSLNFFFRFAFAAYKSIFAFYCMTQLSYGAKEVGFCLSMMGLGGMFVQGVLVRVTVATLGEERTLVVAMAATASGFGVLSYTTSAVTLVPALTLVAIGYGLAVPCLSALFAQVPVEQGIMQGLAGAIDRFGQAFGPVVGGSLLALLGEAALMRVTGLGLAIISTVCLSFIGEGFIFSWLRNCFCSGRQVPEYARSLRHQREEYNDIHIADLFLCCCCDDEGRPGKGGYRPVGTKDLDMADENIEMAPIAKPKAAEVA